MTGKRTPLSALMSDKDVGNVMKIALRPTKNTVKAAFIYNTRDADGSKTGFPYLQAKNVKVLMNDFSFAMLIVANIQYALRKVTSDNRYKSMTNKVKGYTKNMLKQGGTIRCLISANKKRGVLHRKYVVNAQQLSASIDNENGFKGILDIVYEGYNDPNGKDVDKIKEGLIKKYQTKAKRMTNWIMNGPDTLRAVLGILEKTETITNNQEKTAEEILETLEKQDEEPVDITPDSVIIPNGFLKHVELYKKLFTNPKKNEIEGQRIKSPKGTFFWAPSLASTKSGIGFLFDPKEYKDCGYEFTQDELKILRYIFGKSDQYQYLNGWSELKDDSGIAVKLNAAGSYDDGTLDLDEYSSQMKRNFVFIGELLKGYVSSGNRSGASSGDGRDAPGSTTSSGPAPSPVAGGNTVGICWPHGLDRKHLDVYKKLFEYGRKGGTILGCLLGSTWNSKDAKGYIPIFSDPVYGKKENMKTIFETGKTGVIDALNTNEKESLKAILNAIANLSGLNDLEVIQESLPGFVVATFRKEVKGARIQKGIGSWIHDAKVGLQYLGVAIAPGPVAGGSVKPRKAAPGTKKFTSTTLDECRKIADEGASSEGRGVADYQQRFYVGKVNGEPYRESKRGNPETAKQLVPLIDGNNEKIREFFSDPNHPERSRLSGANLECELTLDEIVLSGTTTRVAGISDDEMNKINPDPATGLPALCKKLANGVYMCNEEECKDLVTVASTLIDKTNLKNVLVLNAASQVTPGGAAGWHTAAAEESLCADTSLYQSLTGGDNDDFYETEAGFEYNPAKISIAKGVKIFPKDANGNRTGIKNADEVAGLKSIDILSHASPNFNTSLKVIKGKDTTELMKHTSKANKAIQDSANQMIKAAVKGGYQAFVINNLGGGAFSNSIVAWAEAWRQAIGRFGRDLIIVLALFDYQITKDKIKYNRPIFDKPNKNDSDYVGKKVSDIYTEIFR